MNSADYDAVLEICVEIVRDTLCVMRNACVNSGMRESAIPSLLIG